MRKIYKNKKAVSTVVGTVMMLAIMVPAIAVLNIYFVQMMDTQRVMMDAQIDLMQRFTEYVDEVYFQFSPSFDNGNRAPTITDEYPANEAVGVELQPQCHVFVGDEDGDKLTVCFFEYTTISMSWEKVPETFFCNANTTLYWDYGNADQHGITYYWYVTAYDGTVITTSNIYSFKTILLTNNPPYIPSSPLPIDGAINVDPMVHFGWMGGDPDNDDVTYDLSVTPTVGNVSMSIHVGTYQGTGHYWVTHNLTSPLSQNTTYIWAVKATDEHGAITYGPEWQLTTGITEIPL